MFITDDTDLEKSIEDSSINPLDNNNQFKLRLILGTLYTINSWSTITLLTYSFKGFLEIFFKEIYSILNIIIPNFGIFLQYFLAKYNTLFKNPSQFNILIISLILGNIGQIAMVSDYKETLKENYLVAKESLYNIIQCLTDKNINDIDENSILNAKIATETKENEQDITITKRFYLLDKKGKIRVLKEVKEKIMKSKETIKLYLEEDIDEAELPVETTLTLRFKNK